MDEGTLYARKVVDGDIIAGKKVIKACKRHLNDLQRQESDSFEYVYIPERAERAIQFMEILPDITTGKPIPMADFQKFIIYSLFAWCRKDNTSLRRFNKALISMARKNSKSFLISGIAIYELLAGKHPQQNRQIYATAQSREQANIVFDMVVQRLNGVLAKSEDLNNQIKRRNNDINHLPSYSVLKPLSKDTGNINGLAPTLSILDEYGASKDNSMMEVLESGTMLQPNALTLIISTAYFDMNSPMYQQEYKYGEKILDHEIDNENYFVLIYEQDDEEEIYGDESLWLKSNPLMNTKGIGSVLLKNLKDRRDEAIDKNDMLGLIVKNFNMWVQANENSFVPAKEWESCAVEPMNVTGHDCYIGLDLARVNDIAALNFMIPIGVDKLYTFSHSFISSVVSIEEKSAKDKIDYQIMIDNDLMTASDTGSGFISYTQIINKLFEIVNRFNLNVISINYDSWSSDRFLLEYEQMAEGTDFEDIPFIEVPQNYKHLSQPIKEFQMKVYERNIKHDGNPLSNIAVNNAVLRYDNNRNVILDKSKQREKIDNLVAMIIAFYEARFHDYKEPGLTESDIMSVDFGF